MTISWGTMKLYIQEGILKDEPGEESRLTPEQLQAYARWACAMLSFHTARADCLVYSCDGVTNTFALPSDLVGDIAKNSLVAYDDGSLINYLPFYRRLPDVIWPTDLKTKSINAFWEWPTGQLTLGFMPKAGSQVKLYHFRIWKPPIADSDILEFPQWMEQSFVYYVAAAAMEPIGTQAANVRQWNRRQDSGNPEHNPAQKQAKWFVEQAERILNRVDTQDRDNFYNIDPRKPNNK